MADISVTPSAIKPGNARTRIEEGVAGATISAGQAIYADPSDNYKVKPAIATNQTQADNVVGIALNAASPDQPLDYVVQGDVTFNSVLTPGTIYVLGGAAGGVSPSADLTGGRYGTILGIADSATNLRVGVVTSAASSGGAWTPAGLSSLWAWYKSDSGLWQDTPGTTAATNSTNIAQWDDASGNDHHLIQATSGLRPLLTTNVLNGYPSVYFAGDWMRASVTSAPNEDYSLFIVMKLTSMDDDEMFVDVGKYQFYTLTEMMEVGHYWSEAMAAYWNGGLAETGSSWRLHGVIVDGNGNNGTGSLYLDGTLKYSGSSTNQTQSVDNTLTVGASRHGYADWIVPNMEVVEIIILDTAATSQEIQDVNNYIETRYGLTIA